MIQYKIIACDLDETLLSNDASICARNQKAIALAISRGVKFVPCSGRGYVSIQGILRTLHLVEKADQYIIGFNGANITENKGNRSLFWDPLPFAAADALYQKCATYQQCLHVYTRDTVYIANITADEKAFLHGRMDYVPLSEKSLAFLRGKAEIVKLIVMNTDAAYLEKLSQEVAGLTQEMTISYSSNRYIEFMHQKVSKGRALWKLADMLGVDRKETLAIGDNINDIAMLQAAGLAVGVQNRNPAIDSYCDVITQADNNQGAVAEAIEKYILGKGQDHDY